MAGEAVTAALRGFNSPAANLFNTILSDVRERRQEAQAAAGAAGSGADAGAMQPPSSTASPSATPADDSDAAAADDADVDAAATAAAAAAAAAATGEGGGREATGAVFDAVRDAAAARAREILLSGGDNNVHSPRQLSLLHSSDSSLSPSINTMSDPYKPRV